MPRRLKTSAAELLPPERSIPSLREAARSCRGCPLYEGASQTVFSEGPPDAPIVMVGEVPGEVEDRTGRPFVGPAGRLFSELLAQAGLSRERLYITNSVKHFKWKPEGGRRLHARPTTSELNACKPWLEAEILAIRPRVIVCLGAVAAQLVFGREARVGALRGRFHPTPWGSEAYVTMHPSAILRIPDPETRDRAEVAFVEEMRRIDAHARERTRAA